MKKSLLLLICVLPNFIFGLSLGESIEVVPKKNTLTAFHSKGDKHYLHTAIRNERLNLFSLTDPENNISVINISPVYSEYISLCQTIQGGIWPNIPLRIEIDPQQDSTIITPPIKYHKNAIYGDIGTIIGIWTATAFYERSFLNRELKKKSNKRANQAHYSIFAKLGYGGLVALSFGEGTYALAQLGFLIGRKSSYFEAALGTAYNIKQSIFLYDFIPSASIGYRRQKIGSHFIFRTGISIPETVYFGIGFSF